MFEIDLSGAVWRTSTRSSGNGACVEVAQLNGATAVRDSKHPIGPALIVTQAEWAAFTAGVRSGQFPAEQPARVPPPGSWLSVGSAMWKVDPPLSR